MPRSINSQLTALLPACETQSALVLTLIDTVQTAWIQENAGETIIDSQTFTPHLQINDELRQTIENPVDRVSVSIQNVDKNLGIDLIENLSNYTFADGRILRLYRDIRNPAISQTKTIFNGLLTEIDATEKAVNFSFSPDYIAFGDCVAAETLSGAEWKFPGLPNGSTPGSGGNGDDGGGDPTCPSVDDFVFTSPKTQKKAGLVRIGDKLWNPISLTYSKVIKAERILNQKLSQIRSGNGCLSRSSETHKLLIDASDNQGTQVKNLIVKDWVLTYKTGKLEMSNIVEKLEIGFGDVMLIELEDKHLYINGSKFNRGIVAHNRKEDIIIGGVY